MSMGLLRKTTPRPARNFERGLLPGESSICVQGVSFRQSAIKKLGLGAHVFGLVAERTNAVDTHALMVMGSKNDRTFHVGDLPTGEHSTMALRELTVISAPRELVTAAK
jgi:hypothetical protein